MSAPESVRTKDGMVWTLRTVTSSGIALYAPKGVCECPAFVMATLAELAEHGIQSAELAAAVAEHGAFPMPVGPEPQAPAGYPPALPWARLMDREDLADFLDELAASAITHASGGVALAEVESTIARWRLIAEAQHGHNTAPGPDSEERVAEPADRLTQSFAPVVALREALSREEPHDSPLHQAHRLGHDLDMPGEVDPGDRLLGGDELRRALRGHLFGGGA